MSKFIKYIGKMSVTKICMIATIICMIISMCIVDIMYYNSSKNTTLTIDSSGYRQILPDDTDDTDECSINQRDLDLLAAIIHYEAGSNDCTDRHQQLVAQVVLNRVASDEFPDTIYDVITQTKPTIQYSPYQKVMDNAGNKDIIPQRCYDNALIVLSGEIECPSNVVWQANFKQGSGIYEVYKTSYSTTYFCYR